MPLISSQRDVLRYFIRGEFSAKSSKQVLNYIKLTGQKPGVHKKTRRPTTEKGVIERLAHKTGDPIFAATLRLRRLDKLDGTYVTGFLNRLDAANRIHTTYSHRPATFRLSSVNPNIENILDGDPLSGSIEEKLACDFHRSFEAAPGCKLVSADYDGIEAVETGWFMSDPAYIRLAKLGIHSLVALRMMGQDVDLKQSDSDLLALFKEVKKKHPVVRDKAKRTVHRTNYGSTPRGIQRDDPEMFPTVREAEEIATAYYAVAPGLRPWQLAICERAAREERLGGPGDHPFGFWRWFYDIHHYDSISAEQYARRLAHNEPSVKIEGRHYAIRYGRDAEKAMAFYPSSTAAGIILDDMLELFDPEEGSPRCIHDLYYGHTPLRNQIHDQLILEVPDRQVERAVESLRAVMETPVKQQPCPPEWGFGSHLKLTVTIKVGQVWDDEKMEEVA